MSGTVQYKRQLLLEVTVSGRALLAAMRGVVSEHEKRERKDVQMSSIEQIEVLVPRAMRVSKLAAAKRRVCERK